MSERTATVGRAQCCGAIRFAAVNVDSSEPNAKQRQREIAKHVASCIREGLLIGQATVAQVRGEWGGCPTCEKPAEREPLPKRPRQKSLPLADGATP